jgi:hypothetical protein
VGRFPDPKLASTTDSLTTDLVGQDDSTLRPDGENDFIFDTRRCVRCADVDSRPLAARCVELNGICVGHHFGDRALPSGILPDNYAFGHDTWILGVRGPLGSSSTTSTTAPSAPDRSLLGHALRDPATKSLAPPVCISVGGPDRGHQGLEPTGLCQRPEVISLSLQQTPIDPVR